MKKNETLEYENDWEQTHSDLAMLEDISYEHFAGEQIQIRFWNKESQDMIKPGSNIRYHNHFYKIISDQPTLNENENMSYSSTNANILKVEPKEFKDLYDLDIRKFDAALL